MHKLRNKSYIFWTSPILCTNMHTLKTVLESRTLWWCSYSISWAYKLYYVYNHTKDTWELCDNIGLVGVSAKWSYVTASPSHHDQAIPILSPLLFMHVGHPYIPLFKIHKNFWFTCIKCKPSARSCCACARFWESARVNEHVTESIRKTTKAKACTARTAERLVARCLAPYSAR